MLTATILMFGLVGAIAYSIAHMLKDFDNNGPLWDEWDENGDEW